MISKALGMDDMERTGWSFGLCSGVISLKLAMGGGRLFKDTWLEGKGLCQPRSAQPLLVAAVQGLQITQCLPKMEILGGLACFQIYFLPWVNWMQPSTTNTLTDRW